MEEKPRIRVTTDGQVKSINGHQIPTGDSYANFLASVGLGTRNMSSGSTYQFRMLAGEGGVLEAMYRASGICGVAVDSVADDMVKGGVDFHGTMPPEDAEDLDAAMVTHQVWAQLGDLIKWGRLYGGAIAAIMIDGQDVSTPLELDSVGKGQFKGLAVMDPWMGEPTLNELVTEAGPDLGFPKFYKVTSGVAPVGAAVAPALMGKFIH